jgi:glucose dehydrogenase
VFALDAKTGIPVREFGSGGSVDLFKQLDLTTPLDPIGKIGNSSAPVVSNGVIVIGPALTAGARAEQGKRQGRRHGLRRAHGKSSGPSTRFRASASRATKRG